MNEDATVRDLLSALAERQRVILRERFALGPVITGHQYAARVHDRLVVEFDRITVARNEIIRIMREGV